MPLNLIMVKIANFILCTFCCLVAKSCLTLGNPMDCSPPGSSVHGVSQARILEWAAISFYHEIILTPGSNLSLLHWQVDSLLLSCNFKSVKSCSEFLVQKQAKVRFACRLCLPASGASLRFTSLMNSGQPHMFPWFSK